MRGGLGAGAAAGGTIGPGIAGGITGPGTANGIAGIGTAGGIIGPNGIPGAGIGAPAVGAPVVVAPAFLLFLALVVVCDLVPAFVSLLSVPWVVVPGDVWPLILFLGG